MRGTLLTRTCGWSKLERRSEMKALIVTLITVAVAMATSVDLGIGFGQNLDPQGHIEPIPMLSVGSTLNFDELFSFSPNLSAVGFSDRWEFFATASLGFGPTRLGVAVDEDGKVGSFMGFEAPLTPFARVSSGIWGLGSDRGVYASTGLVLGL